MSWDEGELRAEIASDFAEYSGAWGSDRHYSACIVYASARAATRRAAWAAYAARKRLDAAWVAQRREARRVREATERGRALKRLRDARRDRSREGVRRVAGVCAVCGKRFARDVSTRGECGDGCSPAHTRAIRAGTPVYTYRGVRDTLNGHARRLGVHRDSVRYHVERGMSVADALDKLRGRIP